MQDIELKGDVFASTAKAQTYLFTLPDGINVWLNAASKIQIPANFSNADARVIRLEGEAYFEVSKRSRVKNIAGRLKSERVPFVVYSRGQKVEVLGTHFNEMPIPMKL